MAMHSNKDMNDKPWFFFNEKNSVQEKYWEIRGNGSIVGLSEIIDHIKPQTVSESCRQYILCSNIYF